MGRAFEYRKARKLKRWGNMSRTFTKIGKEITICVKAAGADPVMNPRLRVLMQNAKAANMPKDTVERAIKKATDKDAGDYKEIVYEGYGPFGIAIVVETATDNNTRTVANVRSYFNKHGGSLGTSGSLTFLFEHKSVFKIKPKEGVSIEDLELELIDYGVDEVVADEEEIVLYGAFEEFADLDGAGYFDSGEDCLTRTKGIFVAGDCRKKGVRQVTTATADGATAAVAACRYLDLK